MRYLFYGSTNNIILFLFQNHWESVMKGLNEFDKIWHLIITLEDRTFKYQSLYACIILRRFIWSKYPSLIFRCYFIADDIKRLRGNSSINFRWNAKWKQVILSVKNVNVIKKFWHFLGVVGNLTSLLIFFHCLETGVKNNYFLNRISALVKEMGGNVFRNYEFWLFPRILA